MRGIDKVQLILSIIMEVILAIDIIGAIVTQRVSVVTVVCVALIAMLEIGCNLFIYSRDRKSKEE